MSTSNTSGPFLVGVDCGTQSAKVMVYDRAGAVVARGQQPLRPMSRPQPGVALHPDDDLWDAIAAACGQAMDSFIGDRAAITGVGLCTVRCCKAFLRADGSLLEPVMSWMDARAYQPYLPDHPELAYATTSSGYLAYRFTGQLSDTAANNIVLQWPIDTDTWQWSDDESLYVQFGLRRDQLLPLLMPGDLAGHVTAEAAAATGLPAGVPVVHTANDKAVEMLGAGSLASTSALVSLGTYICGMVHGSRNLHSPVHFWTNFASIPHRYLYESNGVRRGMWTLTWFLDLLGPEMAERAARAGHSREQLLEREAASTPAGSDGLMTVLDWLAPTDQPFRKGSMLGFDARHTRGHVYRSIIEAIALTMHRNITAMAGELGTTLADVVVSGGGANSDLFMQTVADVFGLPASRPAGGGGAALGAAICAAAATRVHPDIETAAALMTGDRDTFSPDPANGDVYRRLGEGLYHDIRGHTDALFQRSYPIFH
jgi:sugar (pentulose or hexulose) kinase